MNRGVKRKPLDEHLTAGTDRADRTNYEEPQLFEPALKPEWLKGIPGASLKWDHYDKIGFISRALRSWDAEPFAHFCVLEMRVNGMLLAKDGYVVVGLMTEYRKSCEIYGLLGSVSRARVRENKKKENAKGDKGKSAEAKKGDGNANVFDIAKYT